jgi:S1-C subfamily serine protease
LRRINHNQKEKQAMNKLKTTLRVLLLLSAFLVSQPVWASKQVFDKTIQSTCWIMVPKSDKEVLYGTGWVVDRQQKQVITNYHVVGEAKKVTVFFPLYRNGQVQVQSSNYQGQGITGQVIRIDAKRDLALIQLPFLPSHIQELPLANSEPIVGQPIYSIGNSSMAGRSPWDGKLWKFRQGTISKIGFHPFVQSNTNVKVEARILFTDCGIRGGDSGGPVVNTQGQLVGVSSAHTPDGSVGYIIHLEEVKEFLRLGRKNLSHNSSSPVRGAWTMHWKQKDQDLYAGIIFQEDGTLLFEGHEKVYTGKYTLNQNSMSWEIPGLNIREQFTVTFAGPSFQFTSQNILFTCTRR